MMVITVIVTSCSNDSKLINKFDNIKELGNENPTLALKMLDSIGSDIRRESEYVQMKYDLLDVRLHDKAYIPAISDIKIKKLVVFLRQMEISRKNKKFTIMKEVSIVT